MGGVDLGDQFCTCYTVKPKTRKWWRVAPLHILDMAICNAWVIMNNTDGATKMSQKEFRVILSEELVGNFSSRQHPGPSTAKKRLMGKHFLKNHFLKKLVLQKCALCVRTYKTRPMRRPHDSA